MLNSRVLKFFGVLLFLGLSQNIYAKCDKDGALDFWFEIHRHQWSLVEKSEAESESAARIVNYKTDYGFHRKDTSYCASYYCLSSVEIEGKNNHQGVYFFQWGGASFPDTNEQSILYADDRSDESCLIRHTGGEQFSKNGLKVLQDIRKKEQ